MSCSHPGQGRILVVGDSAGSLHGEQAVVTGAGYTVTPVSGGDGALAAFEAQPHDLVLIDLVTTGHAGLQTCSRLRSVPSARHTPVVFLAAPNDSPTLREALRCGADDLLLRPVHPAALLLRVRSLLRGSLLHGELARECARLRQRLDEAYIARRQKEELTELAVHDLKNPLACIEANVRYLLAEDASEVLESLRDILTASESMQRLVMDLMDLSRGEVRQLTPKLAPVDLVPLVREVCTSMRRRADERRQRFEFSPSAHPGRVLADQDLLRRMLENLLDNCLKYAPPGSAIQIAARSVCAGFLDVCICDQGPGIPPALRKKVFERYTRLDTAGHAGGHGVGLAFCQLAAEAHGGRIWVEDNAPVGSMFCLRLRAAQ
ncbi:hybrid sensor histidine kinase/response regulator [Corallococcus caeni]|uniref:hybrid sensor histidine kinase/response regulator n=1 Tax=Corallococcus caeni TaxID=3082388 RepID=UPI002956B7AE|nr:hybrid sensor histidine kinase/response regulator [Corallococcus sp. KH5-1]